MSLSVTHVSKSYHTAGAVEGRAVQAVEDVTFTVASGQIVALMGPSGCGKSTLLNLMAGIDPLDAGDIRFNHWHLTAQPTGKQTTKEAEAYRTAYRQAELGFVFQFFNLLPTLTVLENVALPLTLQEQKKAPSWTNAQQQARHWLQRVGLSHRETFYPAQLSGGEMQRTAIARALIHQPRLILADEPTGNLDSETGANILRLLQEISSEQPELLIVMATHSPEAAAIAHQRLTMKDGRLITQTAQTPVAGGVGPA